ncbi:hypothetical protein THUN1379_29000 [Paludibacterium sp. THUN1379]|uniref:TcdA/TcdB pore-forming domain-containing protein n=1 Tax=Paludibacterium sp. THUN1379 TaxID=3112107 RepID=UPI00308B1E89|nr:hypothetical protein THUN1379_29000 [Paludibacterium sp. THUN1379]
MILPDPIPLPPEPDGVEPALAAELADAQWQGAITEAETVERWPEVARAMQAVRQARQQLLSRYPVIRRQVEQANLALNVAQQVMAMSQPGPEAESAAAHAVQLATEAHAAYRQYEVQRQQAEQMRQQAEQLARQVAGEIRRMGAQRVALQEGADALHGDPQLMSPEDFERGMQAEGLMVAVSDDPYARPQMVHFGDVRAALETLQQQTLTPRSQAQQLGVLLAALSATEVDPALSPTLRRLRLQTMARLAALGEPAPNRVHALWIGDLPDAARAALRLLLARQMQADALPGELPWQFYLGHDPRALMAPRLRQIIARVGRASVAGSPPGAARDLRYQRAVLQMQNQAYQAVLAGAQQNGGDFNLAAIDFLVEFQAQSRAELTQWLSEVRQRWIEFDADLRQRFGAGALTLVDLGELLPPDHPVYDAYLQELWLRGNLPAAADLARSTMLHRYGGTYLDTDVSLLPVDEAFGQSVSALETQILREIDLASQPGEQRLTNRIVFSARLCAARIQALGNYLAELPGDPYGVRGLQGELAYEALRDSLLCQHLPGLRALIAEYLPLVAQAPAARVRALGIAPGEALPQLFQRLSPGVVGPAGLSLQVQLNIDLGVDISVMHGQAGAAVFAHYWQTVQRRYRAMSASGQRWFPQVPESLAPDSMFAGKAHGIYRLDGLVEESAATGYMTGPQAYLRAVYDSLQPEEEPARSLWARMDFLDRKALCLAPVRLEMDTPGDLASSWRASGLSALRDEPGSSPYDRQVVVLLDKGMSSLNAARYLNNAHPHSMLIVRLADGTLLSGKRAIVQLKLEDWGSRPRVVLVGHLSADQRTLGELPASTLAQLLGDLLPSDSETPLHIERLRLVASHAMPAPGTLLSGPSYAEQLLRALRQVGVSIGALKGYAGPIAVDVFGHVWVQDGQRGMPVRHAESLRLLARLQGERFECVPVQGRTAALPAPRLPPFAAPLPLVPTQRRAVLLLAPEAALQGMGGDAFHLAIDSLTRKHPTTEFYALTEQHGVWRQWVQRMPPGLDRPWGMRWQPLPAPLAGAFAKLTLLGHAQGDLGLVDLLQDGARLSALSAMLSEVQTIGHLSVLACAMRPENGVLLLRALSTSPGPRIGRITGSERQVFIMGPGDVNPTPLSAGRRLYRVGEVAQHGGHAGKWQVSAREDGSLQVDSLLANLHDKPVQLRPLAAPLIGPFDLLLWQRQAVQARRQVAAWLNEQEDLLTRFYGEHDLPRAQWLALPDSLRRDGRGQYLLSVSDRRQGVVREVVCPDGERLAAVHGALSTLWRQLAPQLQRDDAHRLQWHGAASGQIWQGGTPGSSNGAFLIMALMSCLQAGQLSDEARLSAWWNLAAMGTAATGDGVQLGQLVLAATAPDGAVAQSLALLSRVFEAGNLLFLAGSLVWDAWHLSNSQDWVSQVSRAVQLGMTSGALALQFGASLLAWALPGAASATAFGLLAAPVMALGLGWSAFASQIAAHQQGSHQLLDYLLKAQKAYRQGGFQLEESGLRAAADPYAVITRLDFVRGEVTFGSQMLLRSSPRPISAPHLDMYHEFPLRDSLGLPATVPLRFTADEWLLPSTPQLSLHYEYLAGEVSLNAEEQALVSRLEQAGVFWFDGGIYSASKLQLLASPLQIEVLLAREAQTCWFSQTAQPVSYRLQGHGACYQLKGLHAGLSLQLTDADGLSAPSLFQLQLPEARLMDAGDLQLAQGQLRLRDDQGRWLSVGVSGLQGRLLVSGTAGSWDIDPLRGRMVLMTLDVRRLGDAPWLLRLSRLAAQQQCAPLVRVIQGKLPLPVADLPAQDEALRLAAMTRLSNQTVFDAGQGRLLRHGLEHETALQFGTRFVGASEQHAYFFNGLHQGFWCTSRQDDRAVAQYVLPLNHAEGQVEEVRLQGNLLLVRQRIVLEGDTLQLAYGMTADGPMQLRVLGGLQGKALTAWQAMLAQMVHQPGEALWPALAVALGLQAASARQLSPSLPQHEVALAPWLQVEGRHQDGAEFRHAVQLMQGRVVDLLQTGADDVLLAHHWPHDAGVSLLCWSPRQGRAWRLQLDEHGLVAVQPLATRGIVAVDHQGGLVWLVCGDQQLVVVDAGGQEQHCDWVTLEG